MENSRASIMAGRYYTSVCGRLRGILLPLNTTVNGELSTSDCRVNDVFGSVEHPELADCWSYFGCSRRLVINHSSFGNSSCFLKQLGLSPSIPAAWSVLWRQI
jgi:hypothetical protein